MPRATRAELGLAASQFRSRIHIPHRWCVLPALFCLGTCPTKSCWLSLLAGPLGTAKGEGPSLSWKLELQDQGLPCAQGESVHEHGSCVPDTVLSPLCAALASSAGGPQGYCQDPRLSAPLTTILALSHDTSAPVQKKKDFSQTHRHRLENTVSACRGGTHDRVWWSASAEGQVLQDPRKNRGG